MAADDAAELVDALRRSILAVLERLQPVDAPAPIARVEEVADRLSTLVGILRMQRAAPAEALWHWLHEARSLVNAMVGWAHVLARLESEARRRYALEAIERNAARLEQLLGSPPRLG
jgi:hypothetical protein